MSDNIVIGVLACSRLAVLLALCCATATENGSDVGERRCTDRVDVNQYTACGHCGVGRQKANLRARPKLGDLGISDAFPLRTPTPEAHLELTSGLPSFSLDFILDTDTFLHIYANSNSSE
ncbi:hypothetical protein DFH07DRAFT_409332 [Mycena maculata]|uniref:Secreted protein n=1 Tax=Mycena maculata TaxID=230809 RepID=A0AAD7NJ53_9AGAR|nr:hypothetical protein DFH07DRAFT_409332 [Mycena maculata]